MSRLDRLRFDAALRRAREAAYPAGEFVGQESFMQAGEILRLARRAGIGRGTKVLDLCCGVAGPGRLVTAELGCAYLGVDADPGAVALARERAGDLPCRFEVTSVPPLPEGRFDVVLLLETMLGFADKEPLLAGVTAALPPGGRFAFTVEEGEPLTDAERAAMPHADTVWPLPLDELEALLRRQGLEVRSAEERSRAHGRTAEALTAAFLADRADIAPAVGDRVLDDLVAAHELWGRWLRGGRVRKFAVVAERVGAPSGEPHALRLRSPR